MGCYVCCCNVHPGGTTPRHKFNNFHVYVSLSVYLNYFFLLLHLYGSWLVLLKRENFFAVGNKFSGGRLLIVPLYLLCTNRIPYKNRPKTGSYLKIVYARCFCQDLGSRHSWRLMFGILFSISIPDIFASHLYIFHE